MMAIAPALCAAEPALRSGESMTFRVGWGVFFHAGEIKISAEAATAADGSAQLRVGTTTETTGFARALYTFTARADALFDAKSGRLLTYSEMTKTQNRETKNAVSFDYAKATADYVSTFNPERNLTFPLPAGDPFDLIMSLVQTRTWDLKPGEQRDALVLFDNEFYELTLHALRYEQLSTSLGEFNTLVLEPRMDKTPPKGMFKRGSTVCVWISQDERRLPVRFQVDFKFGAGVATLINYEPPPGGKLTDVKPALAEPAPVKSTVAGAESDAKNPRP